MSTLSNHRILGRIQTNITFKHNIWVILGCLLATSFLFVALLLLIWVWFLDDLFGVFLFVLIDEGGALRQLLRASLRADILRLPIRPKPVQITQIHGSFQNLTLAFWFHIFMFLLIIY